MEGQVWEDSTYDCVARLWILLLLLQQKLMLQILVWFVCPKCWADFMIYLSTHSLGRADECWWESWQLVIQADEGNGQILCELNSSWTAGQKVFNKNNLCKHLLCFTSFLALPFDVKLLVLCCIWISVGGWFAKDVAQMIFMVEALFITWKGNPFRLLIQQQGEGEMRRIREFSIKKIEGIMERRLLTRNCYTRI